MPKCINDKNKYYKGNELSPLGLGISANKLKIGYLKIGRDGNSWIVKKNKNGLKKWMKIILNKNNKYNKNKKLINDYNKLLKKNIINKNTKNYDKLNKLRVTLKNNNFNWLRSHDIFLNKKKKINSEKFKINSNNIRILDPLCLINNFNQKNNLKVKCLKGNWIGYYNYFITKRPNILICYNKDFYKKNNNKIKSNKDELIHIEYNKSICTDSGRIILMDNKNIPRSNLEKNNLYNNIMIKTKNKISKSLNFGYICETGYGEGCYKYVISYFKNKAVKIRIYFII